MSKTSWDRVWFEYAGEAPTIDAPVYRVGPYTVASGGRLLIGVCEFVFGRLCLVRIIDTDRLKMDEETSLVYMPEPQS